MKRKYDVLVVSLHRTMNKHNQRWVRGIEASSLSEASKLAEAMHPNLGVTPTITSMAWPITARKQNESNRTVHAR